MDFLERAVLRNILTPDECKELLFIHKSCSTVGYRPHVQSTTLQHLVASNCASLIMPFIPIRERILDLVESHFKCHMELFVEFTGLISWRKGSSIGWHADNNRPYLKQRHYSAVCYLNDYEKDFSGGVFRFKCGSPQLVKPSTGTVILYSADETNLHSVDEVIKGERCTLAMWFTRDQSCSEDPILLRHLSGISFPQMPKLFEVGLPKEELSKSEDFQDLLGMDSISSPVTEVEGKKNEVEDSEKDQQSREKNRRLLNESQVSELCFKNPSETCFPASCPLPMEISSAMYRIFSFGKPESPASLNVLTTETSADLTKAIENSREEGEVEVVPRVSGSSPAVLTVEADTVDARRESWTDIRLQKLNQLGFRVFVPGETSLTTLEQKGRETLQPIDTERQDLDVTPKPQTECLSELKCNNGETFEEKWLNGGTLFLERDGVVLPFPFRGALHALQVVAFWEWQLKSSARSLCKKCEPFGSSKQNPTEQEEGLRRIVRWAKSVCVNLTSEECRHHENEKDESHVTKRTKREEAKHDPFLPREDFSSVCNNKDESSCVSCEGHRTENGKREVSGTKIPFGYPKAGDICVDCSKSRCVSGTELSSRQLTLSDCTVKTELEQDKGMSIVDSCDVDSCSFECSFCKEWRRQGGSVEGLWALRNCSRHVTRLWQQLQTSLPSWQKMGSIYDVDVGPLDFPT